MPEPIDVNQFDRVLRGLREGYQKKRMDSNCYPPFDRPLIESTDKEWNGTYEHSWWYEDEKANIRYLRIYDVPGTLSGNILRLLDNIPPIIGDCEIQGNEIRPVEDAPPPPPEDEFHDDSEDVTAQLALLPLVSVDPQKHFLKKPKYASEINNQLLCQGGLCPGTPLCLNIVQLLGKTNDGRLVFPKYKTRQNSLIRVHALDTYKSWILQILRSLQTLHGLGIAHRDLRIDNMVWSHDDRTLFLCDLEGRWGNFGAPELLKNASLDAGWSPATDIWDLGSCIKGLLYGNAPINHYVEEEAWKVPAPFTTIVEACEQKDPKQRPALDELMRMVEAI
ncbi:hypothetical protein FH972_024037 [Carpinus fangiana]|uniref:Protein kinase domain-containing protein n=1 Tax=Carpinus fangiana TaxID=176857 RepID=A0A5N6KWV1_9ROSI|nr:hypothetical protein FH972_024037 [Carpinus fangiana]